MISLEQYYETRSWGPDDVSSGKVLIQTKRLKHPSCTETIPVGGTQLQSQAVDLGPVKNCSKSGPIFRHPTIAKVKSQDTCFPEVALSSFFQNVRTSCTAPFDRLMFLALQRKVPVRASTHHVSVWPTTYLFGILNGRDRSLHYLRSNLHDKYHSGSIPEHAGAPILHWKGHDLQDKVYIRRGQLSIVLPAATVVAAEPRNNIHVTSNETIVHVRLARIAGRHFA